MLTVLQKIFAVGCVVGMLSGCGGGSDKPELKLNPVTGTVKVNGEAAKGVSITFVPADGAGADQVAASGTTDEAGKYTLAVSAEEQGIPAGKYRVTFSRLLKPDGTALGPDEMAADAGAENDLAPVYADSSQTPESADVAEGGGTFDFDIKKK
ncbi:carboxypeptidase-like regulatory domain-containing protein [Thalassoglobus sp.]|uniref:carboxypeptidase-like regulatory domain-containing protein n=1 Tax=Thalassoglobus sp. TaxID=2795869 RepID=UPI003AA8D3BA